MSGGLKAEDCQTYALIFAGGVGSRMKGAKLPKQFLKLGGKPIVAHTIEKFEQCDEVDGIVVVCVSDWLDELRNVIKHFEFRKVKAVAPGGASSQGSIFNGLQAVKNLLADDEDAVVLVHDGVRPLIDADTISRCIASVKAKGCTVTTTPAIETVVVQKDDGCVEQIMDRSHCKLARAPQGFMLSQLYQAHLRSQEDGLEFIDSISLMTHYGYKIHTINGPVENIKITTPRDFFTFKAYTDMQEVAQIWE